MKTKSTGQSHSRPGKRVLCWCGAVLIRRWRRPCRLWKARSGSLGGTTDGCSYAKLSESAETLMKAPCSFWRAGWLMAGVMVRVLKASPALKVEARAPATVN
jgi:hypothetical protein